MSDLLDQLKQYRVQLFRPYSQQLLFVANKDRHVDLRESRGADCIVIEGLIILKLIRQGKRILFVPSNEIKFEFYTQGSKPMIVNHFLYQFLAEDLVFAELDEETVAVIRDRLFAIKLMPH